MRVIDAHQHFWNLGRAEYPWMSSAMAPIDRTIEYDELAPIVARTGIDGTVLVQSADNAEDTSYMFEVASSHAAILGVVAWAPLADPPEAARCLHNYRDEPKFVGIRNQISLYDDDAWLRRPEVVESLTLLAGAGVPLDVVSETPGQLANVPILSELLPDLRMVIDHLSKAPVKGSSWEPWRSLMVRASENPRVFAKVSGLYPVSGPRDDWTADDLAPFVDFALDTFGPERLMYGGDWPISVLGGGYDRVWGALHGLLMSYGSDVAEQILGRTATAFYGLDDPGPDA